MEESHTNVITVKSARLFQKKVEREEYKLCFAQIFFTKAEVF